ncbi:hypothetical protein BC826DRAFT_235484 [Russula brevipes]|nr:hypothetical protein BC826DRAFT_235484 [Russula brevipes]
MCLKRQCRTVPQHSVFRGFRTLRLTKKRRRITELTTGAAVPAPRIGKATEIYNLDADQFAGSRVLDVGAGTGGLFTATLYHCIGQDGVVVGHLPSSELIELAKQKLVAGRSGAGRAGSSLSDRIRRDSRYTTPVIVMKQLASPGRVISSLDRWA